jgi:putative FmdB family regulatory protein
MPVYDLYCGDCGWRGERIVPIAERDNQRCASCDTWKPLGRMLSAPLFKFKGVVTKGGGPDKFTADMLGIPLHDLPDGLKTK